MDQIVPLDKFLGPYGREIALERVEYESGMVLLRVKIREGRRHTMLEIDQETARRWAGVMLAFANAPLPPTSSKASDTT